MMDPSSSPATPQRRTTVPSMDDKKIEAALSWIEKCFAIISTLSYSNLAAALMVLQFIRPTASFFLVLLGDFSQLAVVFLRIVARHAEIAAGALEIVNEKYFGRDATNSSSGDDVRTLDNYAEAEVEQHLKTPPRAHNETTLPQENRNKATNMLSGVSVSVQKKKKEKPETKKSLGRTKIMQLREKRRKMGLKVASKTDGNWD